VYRLNIKYTLTDFSMRTNIVIDDKLMEEALRISRIKTKKEAVEEGLKLLVQRKKQENIKNLRGKLKWRGDLEKMRIDDK
jgi:Arc/MetJ family transcription regulator